MAKVSHDKGKFSTQALPLWMSSLSCGRSKVMLFFWIAWFNFLRFFLDHCTFGEVDAQCRCLVSVGYCSAETSRDPEARWCFQHRYHTKLSTSSSARVFCVCLSPECQNNSCLWMLWWISAKFPQCVHTHPCCTFVFPPASCRAAWAGSGVLLCPAEEEEEAVSPSWGCSGPVSFCLPSVQTLVWGHLPACWFPLLK